MNHFLVDEVLVLRPHGTITTLAYSRQRYRTDRVVIGACVSMDSPPLAPQTLLSPFYSNDSLTPFLTISLAPKVMILYSPAQPSTSYPTPARSPSAHLSFSTYPFARFHAHR